MSTLTMLIVILILLLPVAAYIGWYMRGKSGHDKIANAEAYCDKLIEDAQQEAENLKKEKLLEAEERFFQLRQKLEQEEKQKQQRLRELEKQLGIRETNLDRKVDILSKKETELQGLEQNLRQKEKNLLSKEEELDRLISEQNNRLEMISGLTNEEARKLQMDNLMEEVRQESAAMIKDIKDKARLTANQKAKEIIIQAIQRSAISHVTESTVSVVELPDDDMKGRIIGREGRNIRAFETATGVEVLIDDTPELVMLSGFDPIRRKIAKEALETLIYDGRIHPGRIEEVIQKTREEIEEKFYEEGEQAVLEVGLHIAHKELLQTLGKLKYHTSRGQNLLQHSLEVAMLAGYMASELDLDTNAAKRAGLLHEIGVAVENFPATKAAEIAVELAKKYGESAIVQNAIYYANNLDEATEAVSPITIIVGVANEISCARPGAQKPMLETFFKRLRTLEEIANSFMGVTNSYAIQAGREIRVMVEHERVNDAEAEQLAAAISNKIQSSLTYPGQIKITVIRQYRTIDFAK